MTGVDEFYDAEVPIQRKKEYKIKDVVSTKKNKPVAGKIGKFMGITKNNMYRLEVDGTIYNLFVKDLENGTPRLPRTSRRRKSPKSGVKSPRRSRRSKSPASTSPSSVRAEEIADRFINGLSPGIADKVIKAIKRRRSGRSGRRSPKSGGRVRKGCGQHEEINPVTGRCWKKCADDEERNPKTNRCVKRKSKKSKKSPSPKRVVEVRDSVFVDAPQIEYDYEPTRPRVMKDTPMPTDTFLVEEAMREVDEGIPDSIEYE